MGIRNIRIQGDEVLKKISKKVDVIDDKIRQLIDDMVDTMDENRGVGLAAPQIGILKRIIVVCTDKDNLYAVVNPEIVSKEGEQVEYEGCLSVNDVYAEIKRPLKIKVRGLDQNGKDIEVDAEGFLATAFCHEIDHLDGILIVDRAIRLINKEEIDN